MNFLASIWIQAKSSLFTFKKKKKRTKLGTYRFITNFLEENIKNKKKKAKSFCIPVIKV